MTKTPTPPRGRLQAQEHPRTVDTEEGEKATGSLPLMVLQHRDKLSDMISEAETAYWAEAHRINAKGYPNRRAQVEDLVRLGKMAEYTQTLINTQAAVEVVKRSGTD